MSPKSMSDFEITRGITTSRQLPRDIKTTPDPRKVQAYRSAAFLLPQALPSFVTAF
jgi:hypothetical protein